MISGKTVKFILVVVLAIVVAGAIYLLRLSLVKDVRHILLISIDTCRSDYLSCYGYQYKTTPNIDQLSRDSTLFENVFSPIPTTLPAHSSMLTGTIPPYHGIHNNISFQLAQSNLTLQEILRSNGFTTGAIVSSFVLDSQFGLNQGFDSYNDSFEEIRKNVFGSERRADEVSRFAIDWLEKNKKKKFFLFLHYYDPHLDYDPPEPFASIFEGNLYAGEIAYTDHYIGKVLEKLKELGLYDSTLIILTGDHGEMLGEHGEKDHSYFIYQAALKVPLLFKLPGQNKPKRIERFAGIVDIVPTLCSILKLQIPPQICGKNLLPYLEQDQQPGQDRYLYCESLDPSRYNANNLLGVVTDGWKYIQTTNPELYDLVKDPGETNNLIKQQPQRARILKDRLKQILEQTVRGDSSESKLELDEQALKRLESLGYLVGNIKEDFTFDQTKEDPKNLIDFHSQFQHLTKLVFEKKSDQAETLCRKLLLQLPRFYELHSIMGNMAMEQNDYESAVSYLFDAINLEPGDYELHYNLALALTKLDRFEEAIVHYKKVLELRPDDYDTYNGIGSVFFKRAKLDQAAEYFKKALELKPDYTDALCNLGILYFQQGRTDHAINYFKKALELDPGMAPIHHKLADALLDQNKLNEAASHYQTALKLGTSEFEAYHNLGLIRSRQERFSEAIQYYTQALETNANNVDTRYRLAILLLKKEKTEQALKHFEMVLSLSPDKADLPNSIGIVLAQQGKLDMAVTYFNKALAINPQLPQAHLNLAKTLLQQNKIDDAITQYKKLLEFDPNQFQAHNNLGSIFYNQKRFDEASLHLTKSLQINPDQPGPHYNLGIILERQGDLEKAMYHWDKALQLKPDWPNVLNSLAWSKATCEDEKFYDPNEAVQLAGRACELTENKNPFMLDTLATAYAAIGNFPAAVETSEKALELTRSAEQNEFVAEIRKRLELFKAGQPYREIRQSKSTSQ